MFRPNTDNPFRPRVSAAGVVLTCAFCAGWLVPQADGQGVAASTPTPTASQAVAASAEATQPGPGNVSAPAGQQPSLPTCPIAAPLPLTGGAKVVSVSPTSSYEGTIFTLQINGASLSTKWAVRLCATTNGAKITSPASAGTALSSSTVTLVSATVDAPPGSAGTYSVYVYDSTDSAGTLYDTGQKISISTSDDTKYAACVGPNGTAPVNINLQCSFSPLSYDTTYDLFGKGVARKFIGVYVVVQNKNQNLEYLLQDVRGGFTNDYVVSSYDKQIPQGVETKEEQFTWRAVSIRLVAGVASVMTGVSGLTANAILQNATNIFAGPFQAAFQAALPDLSAAELNRINTLGFSVTSTVVPKSSAIAIVAFVPSEMLEPPPSKCATPATSTAKGCKYHLNEFKRYKGKDLHDLFQNMTLSIAGMHVQQVTPTAQPTIKTVITSSPTSIADFKSAITLTVQGSGLDSVKGVEIVSGDGTTVILAQLQGLANASSLDPNVDNIVIPATASVAGPGTYKIEFILANGSIVDTGQTLTVPTPSLTSATATLVAPPQGAAASTLSIVLAGTGLNLPNASITVDGGAPIPLSSSTPAATNSGATVTAPGTVASGHKVQLIIGATPYSTVTTP